MSAVASKNLYELLGNNHDEDSDKEPEPPVKVIDKTPARTTKRNAPAEAPASKAPAPTQGRGDRRAPGGNEGAYRDRQAGSSNNRAKPTPDGQQDRPARAPGTYEGRGNRRGGARGGNMDRHSRGVGGGSEKQADAAWGATEGGAELADEQAGEAIAKDEAKEALGGDAAPNDSAVAEPEAEPEDNHKSYEEYLAELAEKKLALGAGVPEARKANEGSKQDKKWENAKALAKQEEEDFVAAAAGKTKAAKERKTKQVIDIDQRFVEAPEQRGGFRGGRGGENRGGRGGRGGRGEFRGGRGDGRGGRGGRGDGPSRGPRGPGGPPRGGAAPINTNDKSAFPSLGA